MRESINTLIIYGLSSIPEYNHEVVKITSNLNFKINFNCPITGNNFMTLFLETEASSYSETDSLREAIQKFINGDFSYENMVYHYVDSLSSISNKIHNIDIQLAEPFKSLFEKLFDTSSWNIVIPIKKIL